MKRFRSFSVATLLAATLAAATACSAIRPVNSPQVAFVDNHAAESNEHLDFSLTNFTGTSLRGVYLSPSTSAGWEENMLAATVLKDGDTVHIRFDPNEKNIAWDLRIEGVDGHYAEWKDFKLGDISEITLLLKAMPQPTVVAEIQ